MLGTLSIILVLVGAPDIPDPESLTPSQRSVYQNVIGEEFCSCKSSLTIGGCLELKKDCATARHLGDIAYNAAQVGSSSDDILGFLSERVMGSFCGRKTKLKIKGAPSKGKVGAPIQLVEFADFRCGHCRTAVSKVKQALAHHAKSVEVFFVPFPLGSHPESMAAAEASMAAHAQGKFWEMHDLLFEEQADGFTKPKLIAHAKSLNLNMKKFIKAIDTQKYRKRIQSMRDAGLKAGVKGTPAFFVNGRRFDPAPALYTINRRIDMELDRNQGKCQ